MVKKRKSLKTANLSIDRGRAVKDADVKKKADIEKRKHMPNRVCLSCQLYPKQCKGERDWVTLVHCPRYVKKS